MSVHVYVSMCIHVQVCVCVCVCLYKCAHVYGYLWGPKEAIDSSEARVTGSFDCQADMVLGANRGPSAGAERILKH